MTLRIYLLPALAFLTFFLPGTKEYTNVRERTDSLRAELVRDYKPASGKERKLLLIFQKARLLRKANPDLAIKYYEQFLPGSSQGQRTIFMQPRQSPDRKGIYRQAPVLFSH